MIPSTGSNVNRPPETCHRQTPRRAHRDWLSETIIEKVRHLSPRWFHCIWWQWRQRRYLFNAGKVSISSVSKTNWHFKWRHMDPARSSQPRSTRPSFRSRWRAYSGRWRWRHWRGGMDRELQLTCRQWWANRVRWSNTRFITKSLLHLSWVICRARRLL